MLDRIARDDFLPITRQKYSLKPAPSAPDEPSAPCLHLLSSRCAFGQSAHVGMAWLSVVVCLAAQAAEW